MIGGTVPDAALAARLARAATGRDVASVARFPTGSAHYVFEVSFAAGPPVVVRINGAVGQAAMTGAATLSRLLRPLGVPLPEVLAEDLTLPFPHLVLERLPGTDLAHLIRTLPEARLGGIAEPVAAAQRITAATPSAGRYGYAVTPEAAPHARWSAVVQENLERSRRRIVAADLFDLAAVDTLAALIAAAEGDLDAQPALPFLHDTTTKNVIVTPTSGFSGIVDVDDLCFGDPRYVVALTRASLLMLDGPTAYTDLWMGLAGFSDDRLFRLYVALFLVDFMSEHGQVFNGNQRPSSPEARQRLLALFAANLPS